MTDVTLYDDKSQTAAQISENGELVVAPISYSTAYYQSVDVAATPFLIVPAQTSKKFIINSILLASSKTFGSATTAETVTIYESSPADLTANLKTIVQVDLLKNDRLIATALNLSSSTSVSLVAIATDTNVDVTLGGYYVENS